MDKSLRNTLRNVVTQCRRLLEEAVAELLEGRFGIYITGKVEPVDRMKHLSVDDLEYREQLLIHLQHIQAVGFKTKDAIEQLVREVAFTHLNRFCAYKMMETRGLIRKAVSDGLKSQAQIAALALWLRAQRAYQEMGIKKNRPKITKSNIVCAEPMPGEKELLDEFVAELQPTVLGQLVQVVFEKMKLAGEAGLLLIIE
ncbi:MAG: hypothetical protein V7K92_17765 [Nostoc sp.]|uniref:hypothetical protein n=1 Tax=Nostoc sp. TaxID=1180 RepID=UPI002FF373E4